MNTCDTNTDKTANRHTLITKLYLCKLQVNIVLYWRLLPLRPRPAPQPSRRAAPRAGTASRAFVFVFNLGSAYLFL